MLYKLLDTVNQNMHEGRCPNAGCIGECAAISEYLCVGSEGTFYKAHLYLWDKDFQDTALVQKWFEDAGAFDVTISAVLRDIDNEVVDGIAVDGVRPWEVSFLIGERKAELRLVK
jgi:hypothetical protein